MAIYFDTQARKNPQTKEVRFYPRIAPPLQHLNREEFIQKIVSESTITRHDLLAVISALEQHIVECLRNGTGLKLGDLGSFRLGYRTEGQETKDAVSVEDVKSLRIVFTPSAKMKWGVNKKNPLVQLYMKKED